jgi:hypothetical protein
LISTSFYLLGIGHLAIKHYDRDDTDNDDNDDRVDDRNNDYDDDDRNNDNLMIMMGMLIIEITVV